MGFLDYFKRTRQTASIAKDRLSIIVARERNATRPGKMTNYLPQLQQELLQVISKYEHIDLDQVSVHVVDDHTILVGNDNNAPFSNGRARSATNASPRCRHSWGACANTPNSRKPSKRNSTG